MLGIRGFGIDGGELGLFGAGGVSGATAVGKVLLAHGGRGLLEAVVSGGLEACTPHTIVAPGLLAGVLERVRRDGVAFAIEEMGLGGCSVAAPITASNATVVASLGLVVRSSTDLTPLVAAVRTAALGVSRQLSKIEVVDGWQSGHGAG